MKSLLKRGILLVLMAAFCLCASGCSFGLSASPEDLYTLPKLPDEYTELDNCIQKLISDGAEYAAPISGTNVQPVQLVDLDGDGQQEAIAFLRKASDEKPLKIYIFEKDNDTYRQRTVIEGSGTSIYSVMYDDLDGDGMMEMLVGWKVGAELQALTVFTLRGPEPMELMSTNYVKYAVTSLDSDKHKELVVLRADDEGSGVADYYTWRKGTSLELTSTARLSMTMAELNSGRLTRGKLQGGAPALFVTGVSDSSVEITDILTTRNGELFNAVLSDTTGVSTEIYKFLSLYPADINGDGVMEIPSPVSLPSHDDGGGDLNPSYRIDWRRYDSAGVATTVESTYHDIDDGWYLVLPDSWNGKILITRAQTGIDEVTVTFSIRGDGSTPPKDFLAVSTITGNSREIKAVRGNRFILSRQAETIYAAELLDANSTWDYGMTEDQLCAAFSLIATEWMSGDY